MSSTAIRCTSTALVKVARRSFYRPVEPPIRYGGTGFRSNWQTTRAYALSIDLAWVGAITRLGLPRLTDPTTFHNAGYPSAVALELVAMRSRNEVIDTDYEEFQAEMWALTEASAAAENLGDLPMAVLWAPESWKSQDAYLTELPAARAEISTYSANSVTRSIEGADHVSILGNEVYAQQVSAAILDVMEAAQSGNPLTMK
jgi:hypothetical protein